MSSAGQAGRRGFSLVEIVMAIGIVAFALVAMLGLFPVGYRTGLDGRRETRAAYLTEQIIGDLRASNFTNALVFYGTDPALLKSLRVDLRQAGEYFFTADEKSCLASLLPDRSDYENGSRNSDASYLISVKVTPDNELPSLSRIDVEVSAPAQAVLKYRSRFGVATLIGARQ